MKPVRTAAIAGLVLAVFGLPVAAYALTGSDDPSTPTTTHASSPADDDDATESAEPTEADETDEPGDDATGSGHADDSSAAGRAHAAAMKAWAQCVAKAAGQKKTAPRTGPPKLACGDKPMPPGLAKHLADHTGPYAAGKGGPGKSAHAKKHARPTS
jgi:hypothetical protein